ncbi:MAG TPA: phosphatase [Prolixibacteraceae bacterium]|jgi:HAD superfamily hydrolase (TIGR01509 family)|nr:phosphatase [Prolixibacteraceae bacterium]
MIKAIIFDMDGVLVDSEPFNVEIERRQFELNHLSITEEEHHQYMGVASDVMWRKIALGHSLPIEIETLIDQNRTESILFFTEVNHIPVMPGLVDLLEQLTKKNYPMAVASSSFPEIIELILQRTGLRKYFQVVVSSQEAGKSKPEPDVFLLAAQRLGVNPQDCLVIEDSANGIKAAHAAGIRCIAFQGPGANPDHQKEADTVVKSFDQLSLLF